MPLLRRVRQCGGETGELALLAAELPSGCARGVAHGASLGLLRGSVAGFLATAGMTAAAGFGFLPALALRASRFSTWRASLRFWRLRLVPAGFRFVRRVNGGSQAVRASDEPRQSRSFPFSSCFAFGLVSKNAGIPGATARPRRARHRKAFPCHPARRCIARICRRPRGQICLGCPES